MKFKILHFLSIFIILHPIDIQRREHVELHVFTIYLTTRQKIMGTFFKNAKMWFVSWILYKFNSLLRIFFMILYSVISSPLVWIMHEVMELLTHSIFDKLHQVINLLKSNILNPLCNSMFISLSWSIECIIDQFLLVLADRYKKNYISTSTETFSSPQTNLSLKCSIRCICPKSSPKNKLHQIWSSKFCAFYLFSSFYIELIFKEKNI